MGIIVDMEREFIERTLRLIAQYEQWLHNVEFEHQYNYTLLINCLLGLVVMPKERVIARLPNERITQQLRTEMGCVNSFIHPDITHLRDFIVALRHSIAHFNIAVRSIDNSDLIDEIVFNDDVKAPGYEVAVFKAPELLPFMRYYANWVLHNLGLHNI
jgi:hypothetical protein